MIKPVQCLKNEQELITKSMVKKNGKFSIAPLPFILQNLSSNKREYMIGSL